MPSPGRGRVVGLVALLAFALAAGSVGGVGSVSQAAEPGSPAAASSPAVEPPAAPAAGPIDEAEARARVVSLGAAALGLPVDQVDLFVLEFGLIPGDPGRWAGGKVVRIGGTEAVVAWANLDTGEVIDGATFETRSRAGGVNEGKIDPTLARLLDAAAPTDGLTVAVLVRGGPREAISAGVKARYPNVNFIADVPDTADDALNLEIRGARRTAYREAAQRALTPVIARATALGMTVEYAARFAPLVYVTGAPDAIRQLATGSPVIRIMASTGTRETMASAGPTDQATWSDSSGFRGAGSRIAVVEYQNVRWSATGLSTIPSTRRVSYSTTGSIDPGDHPTRVMGTIANQTSGSRGIAPDAFYISSSTGGGLSGETRDFRILQAIDTAVDPALGNADVVNLSIVQDTPAGASALTAYVDELARSGLGVHFTTAGGNRSQCDTTSGMEVLNRIRPPGDAWNSITVGGIDDKNTASWSGDTVWDHCYLDPPGRTFKPEMSAPAVSISVAGLPAQSGVSFANPQVAGAFGQLIGQKPTELRDWPVKRRRRSSWRRARSTGRRTPARWMPPSTTARASAR
ncbi:MAG: hypothetical protein C0498_13710 [Anaerolinea sp.]|nr:hypothetical protein [Anaerolinea sp.]